MIGEDETEDEKERTAKKMEKATERGEGNKGGSREQKREKERRRRGKEQAGKGDRKNAPAIITLNTFFFNSTPLCVHRSGLTGQGYCGRPLSGTAAVALPQPKNLPTPQAALRATDENARLPQGSKLEP